MGKCGAIQLDPITVLRADGGPSHGASVPPHRETTEVSPPHEPSCTPQTMSKHYRWENLPLVNALLPCPFFPFLELYQPSVMGSCLRQGLPALYLPANCKVCDTHLRSHISRKPSSPLKPHCAASDPRVVGCILGCFLLFPTERPL